MNQYAIIGLGCAGYHAARTLRALCPDAGIDVFQEGGACTYNPMLTTYYAGDKIEYARMFPFGNEDELASELRLNLKGQRVRRVDVLKKQVETEDGEVYSYDSILLSTGASALKPSFFKVENRQVFFMRTLDDAGILKKHLELNEVKTAAVIGASMVGIKVAELLHQRGIETTLIDAAEYLFPLAAYRSTADVITGELERQGLRFKMGARVSGANEDGVLFQDGSVLAADVVCLCIGTRANVDLVANTEVVDGQRLNIRNGIVIDSSMQTSEPGIYAAGDCCEGMNLQTGESMIIGLWANAAAQGQCAGRNMAGIPSHYYGNFPHNITRFFGMTFVGIGDPTLPGRHICYKNDRLSIELVTNEGQHQSMNLLGDCHISGVLKNILLRQFLVGASPLSSVQKGLLMSAGLPEAFIEVLGGASNHE